MRLGTCIALELALAASAAGGVWLGVGYSVRLAELGSHEAAAATTTPAQTPMRLPAAELHVAAPGEPTTVFDAPDDVLLAPLGIAPVTHVKLNHGGTSLSLRVDFANGARAAFKPEQTHPQSDPRREIAAYRIDRLLGIGHVPPAKPVALPLADVIAATDPELRTYSERRIEDEAIARNGVLRGELSWWIPEIKDAMMGGVRIDDPEGYALWTQYLQPGAEIPADVKPLVEQIVACILFDIVIDNADRWTGNNTKTSVDRKTLYFMDNTLAFSIFTYGHEANLWPLKRISVFPRGLVARLRALTFSSLKAALALDDDPTGLGPLLTDEEIRAILARRDHLVQHIDELIAELGEDAVLALP